MKPRAGDAVGVSADGRPEEAARGEITGEIVMAEHDILASPVAVTRLQRLQRRAEGDDPGFETIRAAQHHALDRRAVRHCAE